MPGEYRPARRRAQTWCGRLLHACFGFVPESTLKRVQPAGQLPTALMPITSDTRGVSTMPICIPRTFELSSRSIFLLVGNIPDVHTPLKSLGWSDRKRLGLAGRPGPPAITKPGRRQTLAHRLRLSHSCHARFFDETFTLLNLKQPKMPKWSRLPLVKRKGDPAVRIRRKAPS